MGQFVKLYVKVDGKPHSAHRSAEGVYEVSVQDIRSRGERAREALDAAIECAPFLGDNPDLYAIHVFDEEGCEVTPITRSLPEKEDIARFIGRVLHYPEFIDMN